VGSDLKTVLRAIKQAAQAPKATVAVTVERAGAGRDLDVSLNVNAPPALTLHEAVDVAVAVTEDNLTTSVRSSTFPLMNPVSSSAPTW
jgi:hypothetical protein